MLKGKLQTIFFFLYREFNLIGGTKINHVAYKFGEFIVVTNRNNNTLENHDKITLNKDDDIGGSQIPVI